jgi:hypothetical protein
MDHKRRYFQMDGACLIWLEEQASLAGRGHIQRQPEIAQGITRELELKNMRICCVIAYRTRVSFRPTSSVAKRSKYGDDFLQTAYSLE